MPKNPLAGFHTRIKDLTQASLMNRLLDGLESFAAAKEYREQFINVLPSVIENYWTGNHHGLPHSNDVLNRLGELVLEAPMMMDFYLKNISGVSLIDKEQKIEAALKWAAIGHDLGRLFGFSFEEHEEFGAVLIRSCFEGDNNPEVAELAPLLYNLIVCHDYLTPEISGYGLPQVFFDEPLAELFRLADKTSRSPAAEMRRYYDTGKCWDTPFYDPGLTDEIRFDYRANEDRRDMICYALILFAIQPSHFLYQETATAYEKWARGKAYALKELIRQARQENLSAQEILDIHGIIERFHERFNIPYRY